MSQPWRIIGIDCAVNDKNVGIAVGELRRDRLVVRDAMQCSQKKSVVDTACALAGDSRRVLFAFDAPLGWPAALGERLINHRAGAPIRLDSHELFRRLTDEVVKDEADQQPFDVGADRIARTAVAALKVLDKIGDGLGGPIPLVWSPPNDDAVVAIEVYPAATLRQLGVIPQSYKEPEHAERRAEIIRSLANVADLAAIATTAEAHADAFDAAICVIAGADFLRGRCRAPRQDELEAAQREGWIWFSEAAAPPRP